MQFGRALGAAMRTLLVIMLVWWPVALVAGVTEAMKQPGVVVLMRHALAPGTGDPARFDLGDCSTQRNLDARGREQARRTGATLCPASVTFDAVWTSQWCRSRDTAALIDMGPVQEKPPLNSLFAGR